MKNELITVTEMTEILIKKYSLPINPDIGTDFSTFRQKVSRALKETGIWEQGEEKLIGKEKIRKFKMIYLLQLESSKQMYDYLRDKSENKKYQNDKRYKEVVDIAEKRRKDFIKKQKTSRPFIPLSVLPTVSKEEFTISNDNDSVTPTINQEELITHADHIMIKAIFELFFTPIDERMLFGDMFRYKYLSDESNLGVEDLEAEERLANPEGNYYKKKDETILMIEEQKKRLHKTGTKKEG